MSKRRRKHPGDVLGKIVGDRLAERAPRRSRAKQWSDANVDAVEREHAAQRLAAKHQPVPTEGVSIHPILFPIVESIMRDVVVDELAHSIDPAVDRAAIIRAVLCRDFDNELFRQHFERGTVDAQRAFRWLLLCRVRAAMNELKAMADELDDAVAPVREGDPRNTKPVPKSALWRLANPGREPKNTAEVSRWYADSIPGPHGCDPDPSNPTPENERKFVTVNLRLFAAKFGLSLDAVCASLP